jgi:hypothetical protein
MAILGMSFRNQESIANMSDTISRRAILARMGVALGAGVTLSAGAALQSTAAYGDAATPAALPHLSPSDPAAVKLSYIEEAGHVDLKTHPDYVAGSVCDNCLLLQGKPGNTYRPCTVFPGKLVKISGWCSSWTAEM